MADKYYIFEEPFAPFRFELIRESSDQKVREAILRGRAISNLSNSNRPMSYWRTKRLTFGGEGPLKPGWRGPFSFIEALRILAIQNRRECIELLTETFKEQAHDK